MKLEDHPSVKQYRTLQASKSGRTGAPNTPETLDSHWLKQEFTRNPWRIVAALMLKGAVRDMKKRTDPELHGGAPLLGAKGVCIITHGSSSYRAIYHAIRVAAESVHHHLNEVIVSEAEKMGW